VADKTTQFINMDLPNTIWRASAPGTIFLPQLDRETGFWHEGRPLNYPGMAPRTIAQAEGTDVFFSALTFEYDRPRANDTVAGPGVLFADLDGVVPEYAFKHVPWPTMLWQTSGGNYQGVWILTRFVSPLEYPRWARVNHALTRATGADAGGWMGSKVLRIPYSYNYKRDVPERGHVVWNEGQEFYFEDLEEKLQRWMDPLDTLLVYTHTSFAPATAVVIDSEDPIDRMAIYRKYWDRLPLRVRSWIMQEKVDDRSIMIWRTATALAESTDLTDQEAFELLSKTPWNKFRSRPKQLVRDIGRAYSLVKGFSEEQAMVIFPDDGEGSPSD